MNNNKNDNDDKFAGFGSDFNKKKNY